MYTYQHGEGEYDYWVEFIVEFVDGVINKITLLKFDATDNVERKENDRQFIKGLKQRKQFESTLFFKLIGKPFNKTIWFITHFLNIFGTFLIEVGWKLNRKLRL